MFETHIYIETDSISTKATEKHFGYVLEVMVNGESKTREGFGKITGTYHQAVLTALVEALDRFNQSCEIHIHTEDEFIINMMERNLSGWAGNDFHTSKGKPVANQEEWRRVWALSRKHLVSGEPGRHSFTGWIQTQIAQRKEQ